MLKKNQIMEAKILRFGAFGEGVAEIDGLVVFVPYALENEIVKCKIVKVLKTHAFAILLEVLKPSPDRIKPICPAFNRCGGCDYLHIDYQKQLQIKKSHVVGCVKKYANNDIWVHDCISADNIFNYRNKAQYPMKDYEVGFYARRSHDVVSFDMCYMQNLLDEKIIKAVKEYAKKNSVNIKHIYTRYGNDECMVVLVSNKETLKNQEELVNSLKSISPVIISVILNVNSKETNVILGNKNITLWGKDKINAKIGKLLFEISPNSFFQINPVQTEKLYKKAKEVADFSKDDVVADLYCGIGTIGMYMADSVKEVVGVEVVPQAISDAEKNAKNNNINNISFYQGEAETVLPELVKSKKLDCVIIDPPRKGCHEDLINCLNELSLKKILYISCNPATLARDIKLLTNYKATEIYPLDMFPNTVHVECCLLLCREE